MLRFRGRMGRYDYARLAPIAWIVMNVIAFLGAVPMHTVDPSYPLRHLPPSLRDLALPYGASVTLIAFGMAIIVFIALFLLSLNVRRFHDISLSGWFVLLWIAIASFTPTLEFGDYLPTLKDVIWYAVLVTIPGAKGLNKYGTPTHGEEAEPVAG